MFPKSEKTDKAVTVPEFKREPISPPKRILICAPSNTAVDQITKLLM